MSTALASSQLVPTAYRNKPEDCFVALQMGSEVGLSPMQSIQSIAVINGKPSLYGDAGLALVQSHRAFGGIEEEITGAGDKMVATCKITRKGMPPVIRTFSMADAKMAGLSGKSGPWKTYPRRMLQMRARWWAMRDSFADALAGLQGAEEVIDNPPEPTDTASDDALAEIADLLEETHGDVPKFLAWLGADSVDSIPASKMDQALAMLRRKASGQRAATHTGPVDRPAVPPGAVEGEPEPGPAVESAEAIMADIAACDTPAPTPHADVAPDPITPAQHRRLEARVAERELSREAIKKSCAKKWGVEHLTDLNPEQYNELDAWIETQPVTQKEENHV